MKKIRGLEEVRKARYRLMAMLLDFEEKWQYGSKMKYKHGLSLWEALDMFLLPLTLLVIRRNKLGALCIDFVIKASLQEWNGYFVP